VILALSDEPSRRLGGIGLCALGYSMFSIQDVLVKLLVETYAVPQVLFFRSLIIIVLALAIGGRPGMRAIVHSPNKLALGVRAALMLVAWLSYYSAARHLGLAQLTTIYFAAPIVVVVLSVLILKEKVTPVRWACVIAGFGGVVLAADPGGEVNAFYALSALFAACCWALSVILVRMISRTESTTNQMVVSNILFLLATLAMLPFVWGTPDPTSLAMLGALGLAGGLGQFFLYEGFRTAPASAVAPIEYTGLVWAFLYGYVIWADVPTPQVVVGALVIVASSLVLIWRESVAARRQRALAAD
jgi:S-adenosylmethionine uptake transporter